jgi:predicted deacetylase
LFFNVSLHDISPAREQEARSLLRLCEECGIRRGTLLVVPDWHGRHPLQHQSPLVRWLQELHGNGWEIVMHGQEHLMPEPAGRLHLLQRLIAHRYTDGEGEFYLLPGDEVQRRLALGLAILNGCGLQPSGFIAPAWLMNRSTAPALKHSSFCFATTLTHVYDLRQDRRRFAPVQAFSSRSPGRILASTVSCLINEFLWKVLPFVRVALHPADLDSPPIIRSARRLLKHLARRRTCILFEEYVNMQMPDPGTPGRSRHLPVEVQEGSYAHL